MNAFLLLILSSPSGIFIVRIRPSWIRLPFCLFSRHSSFRPFSPKAKKSSRFQPKVPIWLRAQSHVFFRGCAAFISAAAPESPWSHTSCSVPRGAGGVPLHSLARSPFYALLYRGLRFRDDVTLPHWRACSLPGGGSSAARLGGKRQCRREPGESAGASDHTAGERLRKLWALAWARGRSRPTRWLWARQGLGIACPPSMAWSLSAVGATERSGVHPRHPVPASVRSPGVPAPLRSSVPSIRTSVARAWLAGGPFDFSFVSEGFQTRKPQTGRSALSEGLVDGGDPAFPCFFPLEISVGI